MEEIIVSFVPMVTINGTVLMEKVPFSEHRTIENIAQNRETINIFDIFQATELNWLEKFE